MTCKDCVHFDVCFYYGEKAIRDNTPNAEIGCDNFKNKADYAEVKHGKWSYEYSSNALCGTDATYDWVCSVCKEMSVDDTAFCPNCGAKMDGRGDV